MNEADVFQLISMLTGLRGGPNRQPWMSYGSIQQGPVTLIQQARGQIKSATTSLLGPFFGPIVGSFASDYLVGRDFNKTGTLHNTLSGFLSPSSGTYANASQIMQRRQLQRALQSSRDQSQKELREQFYRNYYKLTMPENTSQAKLQAQVKRAMENAISIPAALQFAFDPAKNQRIMQGVKDTQAGYLYYQQRKQPGNVFSQKQNAERIGAGVIDMAKAANRWQLGQGTGESYGGFSGASVSQLASIMANASQVFDPANIEASITRFQKKVRQTTQALAPLKDIFGEDIKAMTDMIQSVSGQNINQLSPSLIKSIAASTADMARYSGATVAQIASAGQKIFTQSAALGGNTFSRVGANWTGGYYSALLAQGNTPAGVSAVQYAGSTARSIASAQASTGIDMAAMGYGLWKQRNEGKTVDDYMKYIRQLRAQKGMNTTEAIVMAATGRAGGSTQSLMRGLTTQGYREALQSGRLAQLGVEQQYRSRLRSSIAGLAQRGQAMGISMQAWSPLYAVFSNQKKASQIKALLTNSGNADVVKAFAKQNNLDERALQFFINSGGMNQSGTRWATSLQQQGFRNSQDEIRATNKDLNDSGTGAFLSFWRAVSQAASGPAGVNLTQPVVNGRKISRAAFEAQARAVLGVTQTNVAEGTKKRIERLRTAFKSNTQNILAMASSDEGSKDKKLIDSIQKVASGNGSDEDIGYIQARRTGVLGKTQFKNAEAKQKLTDALKEYGRNKDITGASEKLKTQVSRARRLQSFSKLDWQGLGVQASEKQRKWLEESIKGQKGPKAQELYKLSEQEYKKQAGPNALSYEDFRSAYRATSSGYGTTADFQRTLVTLFQRLIRFFQKDFKPKNQSTGIGSDKGGGK